MTKDDIIRMAREAGANMTCDYPDDWFFEDGALERFFHQAYAAGASAEREACAKVCEAWAKWSGEGLQTVAEAIRASGKNEQR